MAKVISVGYAIYRSADRTASVTVDQFTGDPRRCEVSIRQHMGTNAFQRLSLEVTLDEVREMHLSLGSFLADAVATLQRKT